MKWSPPPRKTCIFQRKPLSPGPLWALWTRIHNSRFAIGYHHRPGSFWTLPALSDTHPRRGRSSRFDLVDLSPEIMLSISTMALQIPVSEDHRYRWEGGGIYRAGICERRCALCAARSNRPCGTVISAATPTRPALAHLGTKAWEKSKNRAKEAIEDMAEDLLEIYATREVKRGHAFPSDTSWQHEFDVGLLYEETPDQWRSIEEVKKDMETPVSDGSAYLRRLSDSAKQRSPFAPRLKPPMDGKQVAHSRSHHHSRPAALLHFLRTACGIIPITVEVLSRFRSAAAAEKYLKRPERK